VLKVIERIGNNIDVEKNLSQDKMQIYLANMKKLFFYLKKSEPEANRFAVDYSIQCLKNRIMSNIDNIGKDINANIKLEVSKTFQKKATLN
jgi:hypothetical protein